MRLASRSEEGSASVEFIVAGCVLLIPLVYLVLTLGMVQNAAFGVDSAARHTARAISQSGDTREAARRAEGVLRQTTQSYHLDGSALNVDIECLPVGGECPRAGATLIVRVSAAIALPLVPPILGLDRALRVPVESIAVEKVSRLWGAQ